MDDKQISQVIERVLTEVRRSPSPTAMSTKSTSSGLTQVSASSGNDGIYQSTNEAVSAARAAFEQFSKIPLQERGRMIEEARRAMYPHVRRLAELAVQDTGIGRVEDKIIKNQLALDKSFGIEDIRTRCESGSRGVTMEQFAPFGVIASITPTTNPPPTIINHMIIMPAGGNTIVFNFHPNAAVCCAETVRLMNRAYREAGAPVNLATAVENPTLRSAVEIMEHPDIDLLVVTGGPAVVERAMKSGKRTLAAGPGNPPVIVDETADLDLAARCIVEGASFDNNVLCICEKELFVVRAVADSLIEKMQQHHAILLTAEQTAQLEKVVLTDDGKLQKDLIGKDIQVILQAMHRSTPQNLRLALCDVDFDHPFVQLEMMMPILPVVRVRDYEQAVQSAIRAEHGFGHTAMIYSNDMGRITDFARRIGVNLFAANGNCGTTLGVNAEGCTALTIAGPTGEGVTRPSTFVRSRRVVISNALHTV